MTNEILKCSGIYISTPTYFYAHVDFTTSDIFKLAKINAASSTALFVDLPLGGGSRTHAYFLSNTQSFYIGNI